MTNAMKRTRPIPVTVIRDVDDIAVKRPACRVQCVGGRACVCSAGRHVFHICKHSDCECKAALREGVTA